MITSNGIWTVGVPTSPARWYTLTTIIYRFTIPEIRRLVPLLRLHEVKWSHRVCPSEETAFCVVLARLAYPNRWPAIQDIFGRSATWLSIVWGDVILHLSRTFSGLLGWHPLLDYKRLCRGDVFCGNPSGPRPLIAPAPTLRAHKKYF
jgi:hypothetical protein